MNAKLQFAPIVKELPGVKKLTELCMHGGYWCRSCQCFRDTEDADGYRKCAVCKSRRVKWCPPVEGFAEREEVSPFKTDPKDCHV